jgi:uncharacterized membrane-anchored protein
MKKIVFIVSILLVFAVFNYAIYQKEQVKANGETVFLQLAPADPRSLMQGDYMRLSYAIERNFKGEPSKENGYMIIGLDQNRVGTFKRFYDGKDLTADEKLVHYKFQSNRFQRNGRLQIVPNSFMFQEGHAKFYANAKYGVFKFDSNGKHLLVGLADANFKVIQPNSVN